MVPLKKKKKTAPLFIKQVSNNLLPLITEAGFMAVLFILTLVYFPAKPPTPPSASAETKREDFVEGAKILFT